MAPDRPAQPASGASLKVHHSGGHAYLDLVVDTGASEIVRGATSVGLTRVEFDLLAVLTEHPGIVLSREQLGESVFGEAFDAYDRTIDSHVKNLRHKLGPRPDGEQYIETVRVEGRSSGRNVRVGVRDAGPGISSEDLAHLFERFYQADPARDRSTGTSGLGLSIVRAIIDAHGGSVGVENVAGGGAHFWFELGDATDLQVSGAASSRG